MKVKLRATVEYDVEYNNKDEFDQEEQNFQDLPVGSVLVGTIEIVKEENTEGMTFSEIPAKDLGRLMQICINDKNVATHQLVDIEDTHEIKYFLCPSCAGKVIKTQKIQLGDKVETVRML